MTEQMEEINSKFYRNEVPYPWSESHGLGFASIKPLMGWLQDLFNRVEFFRDWEVNGLPSKFWISAFYFPHAFIAAIKQNYSRKNQIEFNKINIDFEFLSSDGSAFMTEKPEDGC